MKVILQESNLHPINLAVGLCLPSGGILLAGILAVKLWSLYRSSRDFLVIVVVQATCSTKCPRRPLVLGAGQLEH
jgi:hypothetical protein